MRSRSHWQPNGGEKGVPGERQLRSSAVHSGWRARGDDVRMCVVGRRGQRAEQVVGFIEDTAAQNRDDFGEDVDDLREQRVVGELEEYLARMRRSRLLGTKEHHGGVPFRLRHRH